LINPSIPLNDAPYRPIISLKDTSATSIHRAEKRRALYGKEFFFNTSNFNLMAEAKYSTQIDGKLIIFRELNTKSAALMSPSKDLS